MARPSVLLLCAIFATTALGGCFGDDDKDDDGNGNGGTSTPPTPTNNTTPPDPFENVLTPPIAAFTFNVTIDGTVATAPYFARPNQNITVTLDGTNSSDPDGNVTAYAWTITGPNNNSEQGSSALFEFNITKIQAEHFGFYSILLRVLDDDNIFVGTTGGFVINYENVYNAPDGMVGPGTGECNAADQEAGGGLGAPGQEPLVSAGTFATHDMTVRPNATLVELSLVYTATGVSTLGIYLLPPTIAATDCASAVANTAPAASPVTLSYTDANITSGRYTIRVELNGPGVSQYTLTARVTYADPLAAAA